MKVGLTGPSGSGKTTLAHFISNKFNLPFIQGSASIINEPEAREFLMQKYNYEPKGHRNVINMSNINPEFGLDFQKLLLKSRAKKLSESSEFVTDRTPLDNASYFLMQCSHNQPEKVCIDYMTQASYAIGNLTHLVIVKPNDGWTENNESRVDNNFYQHMSYAVFINTYERYFQSVASAFGVKVLILDTWDLSERKNLITQFLENGKEAKQTSLDL